MVRGFAFCTLLGVRARGETQEGNPHAHTYFLSTIAVPS